MLNAGTPLRETTEAFRMMEPPSCNKGSAFCTVKDHAFDVDAEHPVEMLFGDSSQRGVFADSGVGEQNVDAAFLLFHNRIKPVQIREIGCVALDAGHILANLFHCRVQFALATAGYKDVSSFAHEALSRCEADAVLPPVMTATLPSSFFMTLGCARQSEDAAFYTRARLYWKSDGCSLLRCDDFGLAGLRAAELKPETVAAFDRYVKLTEDGFAKHQGFEISCGWIIIPRKSRWCGCGQSMVSPCRRSIKARRSRFPAA